MQKSYSGGFAVFVGALVGLLVCLSLTVITGDDTAWDSQLYYFIGIPVMAVIAYFLGYSFPTGAWRWVLAMVAGQFCSILLVNDLIALWWLTLGFLLVVSIPQFIAALIGSQVAWNHEHS